GCVARRRRISRCDRTRRRTAQPAGDVSRRAHGKTADVRARPRRRVLRRAGRAQDRARRGEGPIPLLVDYSGAREEHAVSNEEISVMIITKKALPRRTFLKGAGTVMALPLLDAMIPAATAWAQTPAKPVPRLGFVYMPMGCDHSRWIPPGEGKLTQLSPILHSLEPVKDQLTVITNTRLQNSYPGTHDTSNSGFLSAAFSKHAESSDYYLGTTIDQIAAKQMGRDTQLPSLELSMDLNPLAGVCNNGYACVYQNCLSWSSPT